MKRASLLGILLTASVFAQAVDIDADKIEEILNEKTNGHVGLLYVDGTLTESPCRLSMDSAWQDVSLGNTPRGDISRPGQVGTPVQFTLYLQDCPEQDYVAANMTTLTKTRSLNQSGFQVSFIAPQDIANPGLIKVDGVAGMALRLQDKYGQLVNISQYSAGTLLAPGQNQVTYTLAPQRTPGVFVPGAYHAVINYFIRYQ